MDFTRFAPPLCMIKENLSMTWSLLDSRLILSQTKLASTLYSAISYRRTRQNNMGNFYRETWLKYIMNFIRILTLTYLHKDLIIFIMGTKLLLSTIYYYAKIEVQHQWKNFHILQCHRFYYLWYGHSILPLTLISCTSTSQMTPKHPLPWGCWVYDVVNSTMFWIPNLWRGISPSTIVWLDRASHWSTSIWIVDEDRVVACSIWSQKRDKTTRKGARRRSMEEHSQSMTS